jgi:hypothetical protein
VLVQCGDPPPPPPNTHARLRACTCAQPPSRTRVCSLAHKFTPTHTHTHTHTRRSKYDHHDRHPHVTHPYLPLYCDSCAYEFPVSHRMRAHPVMYTSAVSSLGGRGGSLRGDRASSSEDDTQDTTEPAVVARLREDALPTCLGVIDEDFQQVCDVT